jgi:hemolysin III
MKLDKIRDPFSSLSHAAAALAAFVGLIFMLASEQASQGIYLGAYLTFGTSMVLLFGASALYHLPVTSEEVIKRLKRLDHMMIFVLIAGSYTPFCLIPLNGTLGWILFGVVWGIAALGILIKIFWLHAPRMLSTALYVGMGWICVFMIKPLSAALNEGALYWLITGGVFYTVGALVYAFKWPNPIADKFGFHDIWHLFVIAGAASHYVSIAVYL